MADIRDTLRLDIDQALRQIRELENALNRALSQITVDVDVGPGVGRLEDDLQDISRITDDIADDGARIDRELRQADDSAEKLEREMRDVARAADKAADQAARIDRETKQASQSAGKLGGSLKGLVIGAAAGFGISEVVRGLGSLVSAASEGTEAINAVNVVFGEASETILAFGRNTEDAVFLSSTEFNKLATVTGTLLQGFNIDAQTSADLIVQLTQRSADLASVLDTEVADPLAAINSALQGQTEAIRRFTGSFSVGEVKAFGQEMFNVTGELTKQQTALAAVEFIMERTAFAQGDAAATAEEFANQQRQLNELWENAQDELGQALIPAIESLLPIMFELIETVGDLVPLFEILAPAVAEAAEEILAFKDPLIDVVRLIGSLAGVTQDAEGGSTLLGTALRKTIDISTFLFLEGGPVVLAWKNAIGLLADLASGSDEVGSKIVDLTKVAGVYSGAQALLNSEIEDAARAVAAQVSAYDDLFRASQPVTTATGDLSGAQALLNDEVANAPGPFDRYASTLEAILTPAEDLKEELGFTEQAFADATKAVDDFRTATLELADPVFAAAQAQERLTSATEALAEIRKDPKATDQALALARLAEFEAKLEADAAKLAIGDFERFIDLFVVGLGATREEVREILTDIGIFTETEFGLEIVATLDTTDVDAKLAEIPSSIDILAAFRIPSIPTARFPDRAPDRLGDTGASVGVMLNINNPVDSDIAGGAAQAANIVSTIPGILNRVR